MSHNQPLNRIEYLDLEFLFRFNSNIISLLDSKTLWDLAKTSKVMFKLAENPDLWKSFLSPGVYHNLKLPFSCLLELLYREKVQPANFLNPILKLIDNQDKVNSKKFYLLMSPKMIEIYNFTGVAPKDFALCSLEQIEALTGLKNRYKTFTLNKKPIKSNLASSKKLADIKEHAKKLFVECGLKPNDFAQLSASQISALCKFDNPNKFFITCKFNPDDFIGLSSSQICIMSTRHNFETFFIRCGLKPQDLLDLDASQIQALTVWNNAENLFTRAGLKPQDFSSLSAHQITPLALSINLEKLFIECELKPQDFLGLNNTQINALALCAHPEILYIKCKLKPQDFIEFSTEQLQVIVLSKNAEILFIENEIPLEELLHLTPQQILNTVNNTNYPLSNAFTNESRAEYLVSDLSVYCLQLQSPSINEYPEEYIPMFETNIN